jgi:AhpD family alkylhydroperoxidase
LHKQLMAMAVTLTTQCPYCIAWHVKAACAAGATTDQMPAETATVAAAMRAGAAITHATHPFEDEV